MMWCVICQEEVTAESSVDDLYLNGYTPGAKGSFGGRICYWCSWNILDTYLPEEREMVS